MQTHLTKNPSLGDLRKALRLNGLVVFAEAYLRKDEHNRKCTQKHGTVKALDIQSWYRKPWIRCNFSRRANQRPLLTSAHVASRSALSTHLAPLRIARSSCLAAHIARKYSYYIKVKAFSKTQYEKIVYNDELYCQRVGGFLETGVIFFTMPLCSWVCRKALVLFIFFFMAYGLLSPYNDDSLVAFFRMLSMPKQIYKVAKHRW